MKFLHTFSRRLFSHHDCWTVCNIAECGTCRNSASERPDSAPEHTWYTLSLSLQGCYNSIFRKHMQHGLPLILYTFYYIINQRLINMIYWGNNGCGRRVPSAGGGGPSDPWCPGRWENGQSLEPYLVKFGSGG